MKAINSSSEGTKSSRVKKKNYSFVISVTKKLVNEQNTILPKSFHYVSYPVLLFKLNCNTSEK